MSRNSGGTYALPAGQPVVSGTTISAATFNTLTADLASEMTDSLDRSGKGGMLAPLRGTDGSVSAPAISFTSATNVGLLLDSGALVVSISGVEVARFASTGIAMTGQTVTTTVLTLAGTWSGSVKRWTDSVTTRVCVAGSATTGAAATDTPATLPVGSRPSALRRFAVAKTIGGVSTAGVVTVDTDGSIRVETGVTNGTTYYFEFSFLPSP